MKFINKTTIKLDKVMNELDAFAVRFTKILEKHIAYVVVSGYVAIMLGRSRATDDVDIIIPKIGKKQFILLHNDLIKNGYWCLFY